MNPIKKALWYIESHFNAEISLDEVAAVAGVSKFYMSRMFAAATGYPVMGYARGRRLSQAAGTLAAGAPDILALAIRTTRPRRRPSSSATPNASTRAPAAARSTSWCQ